MLRELHAELGIPADYARRMPAFEEALELVDAGPNLMGRPVELEPGTFRAWRDMARAAAADEISLLMVSGFRSYAYQAGLIRKKLDAGQVITDILRVNAAPGHSEHHTGRAIDIASPGSRPLTVDFEASAAFAWLSNHAADFGFVLSYPRNNPLGIDYEPWHWARRPG